MSTRPDFNEMARAWLVRAQGRSRVPEEASLADELRRIYELGAAHSIEAADTVDCHTHEARCAIVEAIERIRDATTGRGIKS